MICDKLDVRGQGERIQAIDLQWRRLEEKVGWGTDRESELSFGQARPQSHQYGDHQISSSPVKRVPSLFLSVPGTSQVQLQMPPISLLVLATAAVQFCVGLDQCRANAALPCPSTCLLPPETMA